MSTSRFVTGSSLLFPDLGPFTVGQFAQEPVREGKTTPVVAEPTVPEDRFEMNSIDGYESLLNGTRNV